MYWLGDKNFLQRKIFPDEIFPDKVYLTFESFEYIQVKTASLIPLSKKVCSDVPLSSLVVYLESYGG